MVTYPNEYRWDFIGLSTDTKPTKETSENVTNGSTYYEVNTSKLYVYYGNNWYEKESTGGGGGGESNFATFEIDYNGGALKTVQKASEIKALVDAGKVICGVCKNGEGDDMTVQFNVVIVRFTQYANLMVVYAYDGENNQIITIPLSAATLNDVFTISQ